MGVAQSGRAWVAPSVVGSNPAPRNFYSLLHMPMESKTHNFFLFVIALAIVGSVSFIVGSTTAHLYKEYKYDQCYYAYVNALIILQEPEPEGMAKGYCSGTLPI